MRASRELPLAAAVVLLAYALFFGGGPGDSSLPWLGGGALLAIVVLAAVVGLPDGWASLLPLGVLAGWLAATIAWSTLPDRSWEYANRTLVYALVAAVGLWLAPRRRAFALVLAALLGAVAVAALATKVVPSLHDYSRVARLSAPVGLWNQLALLGDFALPLALWRRRTGGALLAYAWLVALVLTYSRGGIVTAALVVAAWFAFDEERVESAATFVAAALPGAVVVGIAFALPGITSSGQSPHTRRVDGAAFGLLLVAGAVAAALLQRYGPRPRLSRRGRRVLVGAVALAVVAAVVVVAVHGGGSGELGNGGNRVVSTSSNFRLTWWKQALSGWGHHVLAGTGAGTFRLTNLLYRKSSLDATIEPHDLPLQFGTESGVVGLLLLVAAMAALLRFSWRRRGHELALALLLPAYLVHALVDVDWDFVAVSAPAFMAAGSLAGGPLRRRASALEGAVAAGAAVLVFGILLLPWLGHRWSGQAQDAAIDPRTAPRAFVLADRALRVDPLLADPYEAKGFAAWMLNQPPRRVFAHYVAAVHRQPHDPETWLLAGDYALSIGCYRSAYTYLLQYTELDQYGDGGPDYNRARDEVNAGHNNC